MGDDLEDAIRVVDDLEIEPPVLVDPCLPAVAALVVLLGVQEGCWRFCTKNVTCLKNALRTEEGAFSKASMTAWLYSTFIRRVWVS
jgi:hypothetical protein